MQENFKLAEIYESGLLPRWKLGKSCQIWEGELILKQKKDGKKFVERNIKSCL